MAFAILFFALFMAFMFINFNPTFFLFGFFLIVGLLDLNLSSKFDKIDVFGKSIKNFEKPQIKLINPDVTLQELLSKMETSKTQIFVLQLGSGRLINLSEKAVQRFALTYTLSTKLEEIIKE